MALLSMVVYLFAALMVQCCHGEEAYGTWHAYSASDPLTSVSCSDGANGLMTRWGYQTLEPMFPYVAAMAGATWNSPKCGTCVCLTDEAGAGSVCVTVIDACGAVAEGTHFDIAESAFTELFGTAGIQAGHGFAQWLVSDPAMCKGNKGTGSGTSTTTVTTTMSDEQTTTASAAPTTTQASGSCSGQACSDPIQCRSQWGWCGVTEGHCNAQSTWTPACQGGTVVTTGAVVTTTQAPGTSTTTMTRTVRVEQTTTASVAPTTTQASGSCSGQACSDPIQCRSQWGWCGVTEGHCNAQSTWTPACQGATGTTLITTQASGSCTGEPCPDSTHCRSQWGWCGATPTHCNAKSTWSSACARRLRGASAA
jgi:hypothetical protein